MVRPISDAPNRDLAAILNEMECLLVELRERLDAQEEGDDGD